jgi:hypothetical protein
MLYDDLVFHLSSKRLSKYLTLSNNDKKKAVELYETNLNYNSQLHLILSCLEVIMRNNINKALLELDSDWLNNFATFNKKVLNKYNNLKFKPKNNSYEKELEIQIKLIDNAKKLLKEENKPITHDYIISRLMFGFWVRPFRNIYEGELWNTTLYKIFNKPVKRGFIETRINNIRILRNRIAHNEDILNTKYERYVYYIMEILELIDTNLTDWIKKMSRDLFK